MRVKKVALNLASSIASGMLIIIGGLFIQRSIAHTMGLDYLGLNSLMISIVSILSVAELGFGSAIVYHLYKPLADKNWLRVSTLMAYYRRVYLIIAGVVVAAGIVLSLFISHIAGLGADFKDSLPVIFLLYIASSAFSYLLSYKRSLLYADQKTYIVDYIHLWSYLLIGLAQIAVLYFTHNFYLFVIGNIVLSLTENVIVSYVVGRRYPEVSTSSSALLDVRTKEDIYIKIKGLILHKLAAFVVPSSSGIIISTVLGVRSLGLVSNYTIISAAVTGMVMKLSSSITASVGNMMSQVKDNDYIYQVYLRVNFGVALLATSASVLFYVMITPFVSIWYGSDFTLGSQVALPLSVLIYLYILRIAPHSFKQAAGVFYEDRYVPVTEACINILFGVLGAMWFGLEGALWATVFSTSFLHIYAYPKFVYRGILKRSSIGYYRDNIAYLIAYGLSMAGCMFVVEILGLQSFTGFAVVGILIGLTILCLWLAVFWGRRECQYYVRLAMARISKSR